MIEMKNVPIENDGDVPMTKDLSELIREQRVEIESLGVSVTKIVVREDGGPPRFSISFHQGEGSAKARYRLEDKHYDVGHTLHGKSISFYAVKRVKRGEGWQV